jgi:hypothetical protein
MADSQIQKYMFYTKAYKKFMYGLGYSYCRSQIAFGLIAKHNKAAPH